ncbi:hypothetical protein GH714_012145 [Hevea brasiliensis]|uniref:Disease resistance protein At4g27190-like leucine-rich repeats domain-containing protein n=1 Tax=Hevea brasiliensis TaxID=3981 RepID=A0A6A6L2T5_HEVBR|nr:hypothetical protein GH714_012145 [Hevea brasiliensis]
MIPANALSKLSQLEALYMSNSFDRWEADGIRNQGNASLAELEYLSHLMTLEIQILDANILPKHLFSNGLQSYRILIGDGWDWNGNYETSRMLKLKLKTSIHSEYGVKVLLRETEDLYLDEVRGAENVLYDIDGDGFPQLKHLHVQNNTVIQHIINSTKCAACDAFPILESLILENLMNLEKICHGQLAAGSFNKLGILEVAFSNLENLNLREMNDMKSIWHSQLAANSFCKLKSLMTYFQASKFPELWHGGNQGRLFHNVQSLTVDQCAISDIPVPAKSTTVLKQVGKASTLQLSYAERKMAWPISIQELEALGKLVVDDCAFFSNAVSSNLLKYLFLSKMKNELVVERCDSVEELFDLEGLNADEGDVGLLKYLNELRLIDLPRLRHVWNDDPQGILSFKNLKLLQVQNCSSLTNIFTLSMASGLGFSEMPILKRIDMVGCPNMELLASKFCEEQDLSMIAEGNEAGIHNGDFVFSIAASSGGKVAIPSLEELRVEYNTMKDMWSQADFLSGLKGIELTCFSNDSTLLPSYFFQSLPDLEKLVLSDASFEEIIFHEEIISKETRAGLVKLKELKLSKLPRLKHLMDAKLLTVFQYLETLEVLECGRLEILVPSSVSFQNLKTLEVSNCQRLVNLISSSTARSLERLRKMKIEKCELIQEIIVTEADKDEEEEICFGQLKCLELQHLPSLSSFCSGVVTKLEDAYLGHKRWIPSPPKVEKLQSVYNAATLAESSLGTAVLRNAEIEGKSSVNGHNLMKHRSQANKSGNSMEEKPKRIKACASSFHKSLENNGSVEPMVIKPETSTCHRTQWQFLHLLRD